MEIVNKHEICTRPGHWPSQASYNFAINGMGIAGSVGRRGLWCLYSGSVVTSPHLHCLYTDVWCRGVSDVWCCCVLWSVVVSGVVECRLWTGWAGSWAVAGQTAAAPHKWMGPGLSVAGHQGWRHGGVRSDHSLRSILILDLNALRMSRWRIGEMAWCDSCHYQPLFGSLIQR